MNLKIPKELEDWISKIKLRFCFSTRDSLLIPKILKILKKDYAIGHVDFITLTLLIYSGEVEYSIYPETGNTITGRYCCEVTSMLRTLGTVRGAGMEVITSWNSKIGGTCWVSTEELNTKDELTNVLRQILLDRGYP